MVNISNVNIISVGDKGFSVGEKSSVNIINSTVNGANIGLASKDKSNVYVMTHIEQVLNNWNLREIYLTVS